jgi:hypothetical protein
MTRRAYIAGGNPVTRYKYGDRDAEAVEAYRKYHREDMRERYRKRNPFSTPYRPRSRALEDEEAAS